MTESGYSLEEFDYELPEELIAQEPLPRRDHSRLLVYNRQSGKREHRFFYELPVILQKGDLLVLNNSRVIPARLWGWREKTGGRMEVLLVRRVSEAGKWEAMINPARKAPPGEIISFPKGVKGKVESVSDNTGYRIIDFTEHPDLEEKLYELGRMPLPPYIKSEVDDPEKYQTIYSAVEGSIAAPTAGFHFSDAIFNELAEKGIRWVFITLHVGPGTFQPVKTEDIRYHRMHSEKFVVEDNAAQEINKAKSEGNRVIAVGTTSCRVLESLADENGMVDAGEGWTDLFIYPGFDYKVIDGLLTNFHLPRSTLLMLVSAFTGKDKIMELYQEAKEEKYRFYSFGDAMLIV